jgi:taurine transport system substrate-binding protein
VRPATTTSPTRVLVALLGVGVLGLAAACGSSGAAAGGRPTLKLAYFKGSVAGPEAVIAANPDLAAKLDATLRLIPIDSGVAGIAQLKGGAFPAISGVGNPPFVAAVGNGTPIEVVFVESADSAGLVVDGTIGADADLAGGQVGVLVGSTLDFELRGWLAGRKLTGVKVVSFPSEAAAAAAFKAGRVHAVYISQAFLLDLTRHAAGRVVVTAADIAKLGYAALNLLTVTRDYAGANPALVQQLVCAVKQAQRLELGPDAARYIGPAAGLLGVAPQDAIEGTKGYPYIPDSEQLAWFTGPDGTVAAGRLVRNFGLVGNFLVDQDRLTAVPSPAELAAHIDPTFVQQAFSAGGCAR